MRVVLLEDDPRQAEYHSDLIRGWDPNGAIEVEVVATESRFRERLDSGAWEGEARPGAWILDVMVPWETPRPGMKAPPSDVVTGGYFRAGIRCAHLLRKRFPADSRPAIVLLTVLDRRGLEVPPGTRYIAKEGELNDLRRWLDHLRAKA